MMRWIRYGLAIAAVLGSSLVFVPAQEESCRLLDAEAGRKFLPDAVPMETDVIPVDAKNYSALQFPNKSRIAIAGLLTSGMPDSVQKKYRYVLIAETRLRLDRVNLPAGMIGLAPDASAKPDAASLALIARDFSGSEISRVVLTLDASGQPATVALTPKSPTEFELRIGKYVIRGSQR